VSTAVLHTARCPSAGRLPTAQEFVHVNVTGTLPLLEAAANAGVSVVS